MILDFGSLNILLITILQLKKKNRKDLTEFFVEIVLLDFGDGGIVAVIEIIFRNLGISSRFVRLHRALHRNLKILLCCKKVIW